MNRNVEVFSYQLKKERRRRKCAFVIFFICLYIFINIRKFYLDMTGKEDDEKLDNKKPEETSVKGEEKQGEKTVKDEEKQEEKMTKDEEKQESLNEEQMEDKKE